MQPQIRKHRLSLKQSDTVFWRNAGLAIYLTFVRQSRAHQPQDWMTTNHLVKWRYDLLSYNHLVSNKLNHNRYFFNLLFSLSLYYYHYYYCITDVKSMACSSLLNGTFLCQCLSAPMFSFHLTFKTGTFISKDSFEQWVAIIIFLYMLCSEMFFCLKTIFNQIIIFV